jgi:hypothetical protein
MRSGGALAVGAAPAGCGRAAPEQDVEGRRQRAGCGGAARTRDAERRHACSTCGASRRAGPGRHGGAASRPPPL